MLNYLVSLFILGDAQGNVVFNKKGAALALALLTVGFLAGFIAAKVL